MSSGLTPLPPQQRLACGVTTWTYSEPTTNRALEARSPRGQEHSPIHCTPAAERFQRPCAPPGDAGGLPSQAAPRQSTTRKTKCTTLFFSDVSWFSLRFGFTDKFCVGRNFQAQQSVLLELLVALKLLVPYEKLGSLDLPHSDN